MRFALFVLLVAACTTAPGPVPAPQQPLGDAVLAMPENYGVAFENEFVRAVEHHLEPGEREPMHSHPYPRVLYAMTPSRVRVWNGQSRVLESKLGDVAFRDPQIHAIENLGDNEAILLMVELKKPQPIGGFRVADDDGTRLAPETYHLLLENEWVRVIEVRSKPGLRTAMHSHPGRAFRYRLVKTRSRITTESGEVIDAVSETGPYWTTEPSRHILENIGETQSRTVLVELK